MPTKRFALSTCAVNGKIHALDGRASLPQDPRPEVITLSSIMKYDPTADTWITEGDMRVPRTALSASVVAGRIYVIGGFETLVEPISTVKELDLTVFIVDFNGDGKDVLILAEFWGQKRAIVRYRSEAVWRRYRGCPG